MDNPLFGTGFPRDTPTPAEIDSLPMRVAILSGTQKGFTQAAISAAQQSFNAAESAANQITDAALMPSNDALANIGQLQGAISTAGQQTALNAIQGPLKVGQALGYQSQGTPILTPKTTRKRASANSSAAQGAITPTVQLSAAISPMQLTDLGQASTLAQAQAQPISKPPLGVGMGPVGIPAQSPPVFQQIPGGVSLAPQGTPTQPTPIVKPPVGGASTAPTCGVVAFTTMLLGVPYTTLLDAGDPRVVTAIANGATAVSYPNLATALVAHPAGSAGVSNYATGTNPCPTAPSGGGVQPTFPAPVPGGGVQPTFPNIVPPPVPKPIPVVPPPPPAPPPCPCPNINITIPLPEQIPPTILVSVPPCPQCGQQGQPIVFPLPPAPPIINVLPAPVTVTVPPCPKCNAQLPPITIQNNLAPVNVTVPSPGGGTTPTTAQASPPPALSPPTICETCTIPWLNLHYPDFVLASRAAQKTDYDILVDAVNLKLCCGEPLQPGCSMPFLQRMMPEFVSAAKAQGLSDDQVLQQAVNIGLCADVAYSAGLGEGNVGYTAPGSAAAEEAEFDPPTSGEATAQKAVQLNTDATDLCTFSVPVIPDFSGAVAALTATSAECLTGLEKPIQALIESVQSGLRTICSCDSSSFVSDLGIVANNQWNQQTIVGKATYNILQSVIWLLRTFSCNGARISDAFQAATNCADASLPSIVLTQLIAGIWKRWVGDLPPALETTLERVRNYSCPSGLPNVAEANDLFASNFISESQWTCFIRAAGAVPQFQTPLYQARQSRPNDEDLWQRSQYLIARLDQIAADPSVGKPGEAETITKELKTVNELFKHNGWTNEKWWTEWLNTKQWVPTTSDAIQWMIKDVNDPQIVETFLLGAEFTQKYGGDVKRAFDQNAVSQSDAENIWKSHWRNVSPEQIYHMHKRLRPGWTALSTDEEVMSYVESICPRKGPNVTEEVLSSRPTSNGFPVPTYCDELPNAETARTYLESIVVTGYHASEALGQDDFPAFWRPRLLALSYNVLTRVDARRAYELGQFDDAKLTAVYEDQGYKHSDAVTLVKFAHGQLVQRFVRSATAKQWIQYPYPITQLADNLEDDGMRPDLFDEIYPILERKRATFLAVQKLSQVKKAVVNGRMNRQNAVAAVQGILKG